MKIVKNILKNELNIRTEKDFPTKGIEFIDINPLILQKETLNEIIDLFANELKDKKLDYIVAPEARGFIFGTPVAYKLGCGCIPVRKKGKLPPSTVQASFDYEKEYGKDTLELPKLTLLKFNNSSLISSLFISSSSYNVLALSTNLAVFRLAKYILNISAFPNISYISK